MKTALREIEIEARRSAAYNFSGSEHKSFMKLADMARAALNETEETKTMSLPVPRPVPPQPSVDEKKEAFITQYVLNRALACSSAILDATGSARNAERAWNYIQSACKKAT